MLFAQALEIHKRLLPGDNLKVSLALYTLADVRALGGKFAEALAPIEAAVAMDRKLLPSNHTNLLADLEKLARIYNLNRKFEKATPLYEEITKVYESTLGRQDPLTLMLIGNLGANYTAVGRAAAAVPPLKEACSNAKKHPKLSQFGTYLLDAYVAVADPAKPGSTDKAMALFDEVLAVSRATFAKESPELAQELNLKSIRLFTLKAYARAEPLLREALAIREKHQPSSWTTFKTMSMLGESLLGQQKFTEAEPLLLAGYRGMKERKSAVLKDRAPIRIVQSLERLVRLYEAQGNTSEAAPFRIKLSDARPADSRPTMR